MRRLGLSDADFEQRRPLKGQITKAEVRAVSLYALRLGEASIVWDIGAGSGSIAIEAAFIARRGAVYAIERDPASLPLLEANLRRWGDGNIHLAPGAAPAVLAALPNPDCVFIGGSGGQLAAIVDCCLRRLNPGGTLAANFAAPERALELRRQLAEAAMETELSMVSAARGREMPGGALRLESLNPVFIVAGRRAGLPPGDMAAQIDGADTR